MPTKNNQKGFAALAVLSLLFLTVSLTAITVITNNPVRNQITSILAKTKEEKAAAKKEKTQAQQNADARIRREERAAARGERSPCDGAQCVAGDVLKNSKGTAGVANPSAQQIAEQKILDNYISVAANGDKGVLDVLQKQRPDLYAEAQQQIAAGNLAPPGEDRAEALAKADAELRARAAAAAAASQNAEQQQLKNYQQMAQQNLQNQAYATLRTSASVGVGPAGETAAVTGTANFPSNLNTTAQSGAGKVGAGVSGTANFPPTTKSPLNVTGTFGTGPSPYYIPKVVGIITSPNENIIQKGLSIVRATINALSPTSSTQNQVPSPALTGVTSLEQQKVTANTANQLQAQPITQTSNSQLNATGTVGTGTAPSFVSNVISIATKPNENFFQKLSTLAQSVGNGSLFQTTTAPQNQAASKFGQILNPPANPSQSASGTMVNLSQAASAVQPSDLRKIGTGECLAHCDGTRMYELYQWYKAQPNGWWYHDGQFTPVDFAAMMVMGESLGSGDPETVKATASKIAEAISNQLSYSSPENGRPGYCTTSDCQGGGGVFNFIGAYSQSAWIRYNNLIDNPSAKTLQGLRDQQLADYFAKNGISLDQISNDIVKKPASQVDYINLPTEWGCQGCNDPGLKWIQKAIEHNAPTGTTNPWGVYYMGKDGEVVYTLNQAAYWANYNEK